MADEIFDWKRALERIATAVAPPEGFFMERLQRAGTPSRWQEHILLKGGGNARFETIRSRVDEGGAAIGVWEAKAALETVRDAARALVAARIWEHQNQPILPGQDELRYRYGATPGVGSLTLPANSPLLFQLMSLETTLRRVANLLRSSHQGAELRCVLNFQREAAQRCVATVAVENTGDRPGVLTNPLLSPNTDDHVRIEMAHPENLPAGVTGMGPVFSPIQEPSRPKQWPPPWREAHVVLPPRSTLALPLRVPVSLPSGSHVYVRAVFSCYSSPRPIAGHTILRGRVFSNVLDATKLP